MFLEVLIYSFNLYFNKMMSTFKLDMKWFSEWATVSKCYFVL